MFFAIGASEKLFTAFYELEIHTKAMKIRSYSQFDIPRQHLPERGPHYRLPAGSGRAVLYAQEHRGSSLALSMTETLRMGEIDDGHFTRQLIAAAAFNSAWYNYSGIDDSMRHVIKLPVMVEEDGTNRLQADDLLAKASSHFEGAMRNEQKARRIAEVGAMIRPRIQFELGRSLGGASLALAALEVVQGSQWMDKPGAQDQARQAAFELAESARALGATIGSYPSLAQLGTESSEFMLHVRRKAPKATIALLDEALEVETGLSEV